MCQNVERNLEKYRYKQIPSQVFLNFSSSGVFICLSNIMFDLHLRKRFSCIFMT